MSGPTLLICAAGGHAKVLVCALRRGGTPPLGLLDADPARHGTRVMGLDILGGDDVALAQPPDQVILVNGLGSVGSPLIRTRLFERFSQLGYTFAQVIDPSAIIGEDVEMGRGTQVLAGAIIQPGARLGDNCIVNTGARIDHDVTLGSHSHVAPGAVVSGSVIIGKMVHVGTGASIRQGVRIGDNVVIGVGAAVVSDVAAGQTVVGVPARPLK